MRRLILIAMMAGMLNGCALRGPLRVTCPGFASYLHPLGTTPIERQARAAGLPDAAFDLKEKDVKDEGALPRLIVESYDRLENIKININTPPAADRRPILLLSGGGQWGAFGVGFLEQLIADKKYPDFGIVTGVSTGGLQALFVGYGLDHVRENKVSTVEVLKNAYTPKREGEIVNREATKALAVLTGAMANLRPLKHRIEAALCPKIYAPALGDKTCMIDDLRQSQRLMLIGFVEANSGSFKFVGVQDMLTKIAAKYPDDQDKATRESVSCVAGAALSSAAMPVFFQQVNVDGKTYYDGGVRDSVFLGAVQQAKAKADLFLEERRRKWLESRSSGTARPTTVPQAAESKAAPPRPALYVIRNGPTSLDPAAGPDATADVDVKADALTAALRAEAIVVNQLEVGSLTALRLYDPGGDINLVSAEGWKTFTMAKDTMSNGAKQPYPELAGRTCGALKRKPKDAMFNPDFMKCIQQLGAERAQHPWVQLCKYDGTEIRHECDDTQPLLIPKAPQ